MQKKYLSIDIGGSAIKFGIVEGNSVLWKSKMKTPKDSQAELTACLKEIQQLTKEEAFDGVGIVSPGVADNKTGVISYGGALPYLDGLNMKAFGKELFGEECAIINDGKAVALAESMYGNLKGIQNGAALVLGTGVGGGIIIKGELYNGSHLQAGEFSYIFQGASSDPFENFVGASGSGVRLVQFLANKYQLQPDGEEVFTYLTQKNLLMDDLIQKYCAYLGMLIHNLQCSLDLEKIVISGGMSNQPIIIEGIREGIEKIRGQHPIFSQLKNPEIVKAAYGSEANLVGGAAAFQLYEEKE